jgi:hypothetical protein
MAKHQEQQAPVTGRIAAAFGGFQELLDFGGNEVLTVVHHFVQCLEWKNLLNASNGAGSVF